MNEDSIHSISYQGNEETDRPCKIFLWLSATPILKSQYSSLKLAGLDLVQYVRTTSGNNAPNDVTTTADVLDQVSVQCSYEEEVLQRERRE